MTEEQIEARFHAADINGDNELSFKEFDKLLTSFNVTLTIQEREQLFVRFDSDGNGHIQLEEFIKFIHAEQEHLHLNGHKKHSDEANERKWNNSVTYKVDIASIAAQQAKREQARAKKLAKRRSLSPNDRGDNRKGRSGTDNFSEALPSSRGIPARPLSAGPARRPPSPSAGASLAGNLSARRPGTASPFTSRPGSPTTLPLRPKSPSANPAGTVWGRPSALPASAEIAAKHKTKSSRPSRSSILIARGINPLGLSESDLSQSLRNRAMSTSSDTSSGFASSRGGGGYSSSKGAQILTLDHSTEGNDDDDDENGPASSSS